MKRLVFMALLLATFAGAGDQRGLPAREGIANFAKVTEELYRGAQPDAAGIKRLKELGIKSIVCLRTSTKDWKKELAQVQAQGLVCTNLALSGIRRPKTADVTRTLETIKALPGPVFVHCQYGCDRTGTIVACYRIKYQQWSNESALAEAESYGMSRLERGMKDFILEFGRRKH